MSCSTVSATRPRVWIGCLSCYNEGRLVGEWVDATNAGDLTPNDLHGIPTTHEELWVFDLEGFPSGTGEMSPTAAAPWGELYEEVGETQWPALLAWVDSGCYVADSGPWVRLHRDRCSWRRCLHFPFTLTKKTPVTTW